MGTITNIDENIKRCKQLYRTYEQQEMLKLRMKESVIDFLEFVSFHSDKETLELANMYILNQENLNDFINNFYNENTENLYNDLEKYIVWLYDYNALVFWVEY